MRIRAMRIQAATLAMLAVTPLCWASEPVGMIEEVVVTASRIERPDLKYSNPVISLDGEKIRTAGLKDMALFLSELPALSGSITKNDTAGGAAADGTNGITALNLRNLGFLRTLVLVNGRRYVGSPFPGAAFVDIDALPMALIERVEVMTGGASALYGADGVSGVVNFVMKDRFEGLALTAQSGASTKHDAQSRSASLTYGTPVADARGHFSVAFNYADDQRLSRLRRDYSSPEGYVQFVLNPDNPNADPGLPSQAPLRDLRFFDYAYGGAVDVTLDGIPDFNGDGTPWQAGRFVPPFYDQGGDGSAVGAFRQDTLPAEERFGLNVLFDFDLTESLHFFSEFSYNKRDSLGEFTPTFDYFLLFFPDAPFVPSDITTAAAGNPIGVTRDNFDFGVRSDNTERETYRGVLGLEGSFSDHLEFEISYTYGETDVETVDLNNRYNDRFAAALDAVIDPASGEIVCASELDPAAEPFNLTFQEWNDYSPQPGTWAGSFIPGSGDCVPINIFGEGAPSRAALSWIMTDSLSKANMQQQVLQAYVRGDTSNWFTLPAGAVGFVVGAEWRDEEVSANPADENRLGYTFANKYDGERGQQDVTEAFVEVDIPLLAEQPLAKFLALDVAVRHSDYSTTGSATTWKTGLVWQPFDSLTLRGTVAEATRAPSLQELNAPLGQSFEDISDPCDINNLINGTAFRATNCAALLNDIGIDPATYIQPSGLSVSGLNGGNPSLDQEEADTVTWGLIYAPAAIAGLTISVDWYDIEIEEAIEFASPQDAAELCVDLPTLNNEFCNLITRGTDGGITSFVQQPQNVASLTTRGVDFNIRYGFALSRMGFADNWGSLSFELSGNHLEELKTTSLPGAAPVSRLGQKFAPEWQANFDLDWQLGETLLRWQVHYFDETNRFDDLTTRNNPNIVERRYLEFDRKLTHDIFGSHQFTDQLTIYAGINNLTDEQPDIGEIFYPVSAVGRYMFAGLEFRL